MFARNPFRFSVFVIVFGLCASLFAQKEAFDLCRQKAHDAGIFNDGRLLLPVDKGLWLGYTALTPPRDAERYDPFLGLYLVRRMRSFGYPYGFEKCTPESMALIDETQSAGGSFTRRQVGLNTLALFSEPAQLPSLLSGCCCGIEGIVTERGIIEKAYVEHFLKHGTVVYGDIGIRVADSAEGVVVTASDPYFDGNPMRAGDRVLTCGGEKVVSAAALMRDILLAPEGSRLHVTYEREGTELAYDANVSRRFGGGLLSDTFLERLGLYFDEAGSVVHVTKAASSMGIKEGDRILKIGEQTIRGRDDLLLAAGKLKKNTTLLIGRGGFSFFLRLP